MATASTQVAAGHGGQVAIPKIRDRLKDPAMIAELGKAMPAHCKPERMARVALTALTRTPKLAECDQASFFQALLSLSQWGLEPDGRRAHLIPFENRKRGVVEVQLIIDYKGLVELAYRSGVVKAIHADVVREGDVFAYNLGEVRQHVPHFLRRDADKPKDAGEVFAVFAQVTLDNGVTKCEVLSREDVEAVRRRSRAGGNGPWVTDWNEMAKKTAFRRVSKWLPLSADLHDAIDRDDDRHETTNGGVGSTGKVVGMTLDAMLSQSRGDDSETQEVAVEDVSQGEAQDCDNQETPDVDPVAEALRLIGEAKTVLAAQTARDAACGPDSTLGDEQRRMVEDAYTARCAAIRGGRGPRSKGGELFDGGKPLEQQVGD